MADVEQIYEQYFQDVFLFVLSLSRNTTVAEEITQETFVKAVRNINQFKGNCKISVWLCQIAKNSYFTYMEKQQRGETGYVQKELPANSRTMEQTLADKTEALKIHKLLHSLKEPYKEVFTLRVFGELSFAHISEIFGKTESWARVTYHRARGIIQDLLKEESR